MQELKRVMSERERDSDVIDVDKDITAPGASKQTNRTVTDRLIKKPSHEDFGGEERSSAWKRFDVSFLQ